MKDIKKFIVESQLDYEDVLDALYNYLAYNDDFALDAYGEKTGTGKECLKKIGSIIDILDFHNGWDEIASECDTDEDTIVHFIDKNEKKLIRQLKKELK